MAEVVRSFRAALEAHAAGRLMPEAGAFCQTVQPGHHRRLRQDSGDRMPDIMDSIVGPNQFFWDAATVRSFYQRARRRTGIAPGLGGTGLLKASALLAG
ncbi:MAG: hypothetical protein R3D56_04105 [Paracoccaceae bacterium]